LFDYSINSNHRFSIRNGFCNDCTCSNNDIVSDSYIAYDFCACSNKHIVSNHWSFIVFQFINTDCDLVHYCTLLTN